jgi:Mrp family chromosome partitioning ATPase
VTIPDNRPRSIPISRFLRANLGLIILNVLIFAALGWLIGLIRSGTSVAEATILLQDPFSVEVFAPLRADAGGDPELFVNDQIAYLESTDFALQVATALGMPATPESANEILDNLSVSPVEASHLVELEYSANSPEAAAAGATTVVDTYTELVVASVNQPYEIALSALNEAITESDENVDAMQAELASLRDDQTVAAEAEFQALLDQIQALQVTLASAPVDQIPALTAQINALATEANLLQSQISGAAADPALTALAGRLNDALTRQTTLTNRRSELRVQLNSAPSPVAATSLPTETAIAPPSIPTSVIAGALVGLFVGLAWAYWLSDERRRRFVQNDEPRYVLGSQMLGDVLLDEKEPLLATLHPRSPEKAVFSRMYQELATEVVGTEGSSVLAVASNGTDPTKSQVAINLALAAADANVKTLLIDADLAQPETSQTLSQYSGRPRQIGMAEILEGHRDVTPTIQVIDAGGRPLHFISSGKYNITNLNGDGTVSKLLVALREHYQLVVVDLPQNLDSPFVNQLNSTNFDVVVSVRHLSPLNNAFGVRQKLDSLGLGQLGYVYTYRPGFSNWLKGLFRRENAAA